jgi:hypothetical protein
MIDNSIFNKWYKENEEELIQSYSDIEAIAYTAFKSGAEEMELFMSKHFDNSNNKKNFVKKHFWDEL